MAPAKAASTATPAPVPERQLTKDFRLARDRAVPLLGIETADPAATKRALLGALDPQVAVLEWDCLRGLRAVGASGEAVVRALSQHVVMANTINAATALDALAHTVTSARPDGAREERPVVPAETVVLFHNIHLHLSRDKHADVIQGIWNLRDKFKINRRTAVFLGTALALPIELLGDVIVLDEPLPTRADLNEIVDRQYASTKGKVPPPTADERALILDALVGLPAFTAEQVIAMSFRAKGMDLTRLWSHKIKNIEATPGLSVWQWREGEPTLDDLKGLDNAATYVRELIAAKAFSAVAFIDEGDKVFAGAMSSYSGDSGVTKNMNGTFLSYVEDTKSRGFLAAGPAGTGKSQFAKAVAAAARKPLIIFDLNGMKAGVVGESEARLRHALKVLTAVAEGRVLFIMTCNESAIFTPELNRRFPDQFFFDTPTDAARAAIWPVYIQKFRLTEAQTADFAFGVRDKDWTGAEIYRVCDRAAVLGKTLSEASRFLIPQARSQADKIAKLRGDAHERFLSAATEGLYQSPDAPKPVHYQPVSGDSRPLTVEEKD